MDIILAIPVFIIGIILLWKGSDILVDGTSKTAARFGVSSLIISVILVGFGTSAPEFAISVGSALQNNPDISLGNIVGSCICNLLLVLGIGALIKPLEIKKSVIKREAPIVLAVTIFLLVLALLNLLDAYHIIGGIIFLIVFVFFIIYFIRIANKERIKIKEYAAEKTLKNIVFIILGILAVIAGAELLIESSICIANFFCIPTFIIALSIVAIGTSLPELVVSAMASYKDEDDIAVGNVLGSNVFNILLILGFSASFIPLNAIISIDEIIILVLVTIVLFPIIYTGKIISRLEGAIMLVLYAVFIWYIFIGHSFMPF